MPPKSHFLDFLRFIFASSFRSQCLAQRVKLNDSSAADAADQKSNEGTASRPPSKKPTAAGGWVKAEDGLHGVLVSCDLGKEPKCTKEMLDLLNEIADQYFPVGGEPEDVPPSDLSVSLRKELGQLKTGETRRFFSYVCSEHSLQR